MNSKLLCTLLLTASAAFPQWTGSGFNSAKSDGAIVIAANDARVVGGVFTWNPARDGWDADADNVYHFASFRIDPGVVVRVRADRMRRPGPMVWLVQGAVDIRGTLDISGNTGVGCGDIGNRAPTIPGPGGFPGGVGGWGSNPAQRGFGPGSSAYISTSVGGGAYQCSANHSGTGFVGKPLDVLGSAFYDCSPPTYGNSFLVPLVGGSGGAGSLYNSSGGAGGGAIRISSDVSISFGTTTANDGSIQALGGGAIGCGTPAFGLGGMGSGGAVHLQAPTVQTGSRATHGVSTQGASTSVGVCCNSQNISASAGRIRIDASALLGTGTMTPPANIGPLVNVPLPSTPTLQISSVDGVAVSAIPGGAYLVPDVTINKTTPVAVVVSGQFIPPGTPINLFVSTDIGGTDIIVPAVLAGTLETGTATVNVTFPNGVHRIYLRATW